MGITPMQLKGALVEASKQQRPEVNSPHFVIHLLEADVLLRQNLAHVHPTAPPPDPAIPAHQPPLEVRRVLQFRDPLRIGPKRGPVDGRRRPLSQRLMWPLLVVLTDEPIEPPLLRLHARSRRPSRPRLQRLVESLVTPVLLWMAGAGPPPGR